MKDERKLINKFCEFVEYKKNDGLKLLVNLFFLSEEYQSIPDAKKPDFPNWIETIENHKLVESPRATYEWLRNWYYGESIPDEPTAPFAQAIRNIVNEEWREKIRNMRSTFYADSPAYEMLTELLEDKQ